MKNLFQSLSIFLISLLSFVSNSIQNGTNFGTSYCSMSDLNEFLNGIQYQTYYTYLTPDNSNKLCFDQRYKNFSTQTNCTWDDFKTLINPTKSLEAYLVFHCSFSNTTIDVLAKKDASLKKMLQNDTSCQKIDCPNPCRRQLCKSKSYIENSYCTKLNSYYNGYECKCMKYTKWSQNLLKCLIENPCLNAEACSGYDRANICLFDSENLSLKCECRSNWEGQFCNETNIHKRKKKDPCEDLECVNGYCLAENHTCICDYGWTGTFCHKEITYYYPWNPWTTCQPKCTNHSDQRRLRHRRRNCSRSLEECLKYDDKDSDTIECSILRCNLYDHIKPFQWGNWQSCDAKCGLGLEHSFKKCSFLDSNNYRCDKDSRINRSRVCLKRNCITLDKKTKAKISIFFLVIFFVCSFGFLIHACNEKANLKKIEEPNQDNDSEKNLENLEEPNQDNDYEDNSENLEEPNQDNDYEDNLENLEEPNQDNDYEENLGNLEEPNQDNDYEDNSENLEEPNQDNDYEENSEDLEEPNQESFK